MNDNPKRSFKRLKNSIRRRSRYKKVYILNPLLGRDQRYGIVELNDFGGRFADLKQSVVRCGEELGFSVLKNSVNSKTGWWGKKDVLLGRTFSFEHLAFSTPRLEGLLEGFAEEGINQRQLDRTDVLSEIEAILEAEIGWLAKQLARRDVKAIFLHDDQRPAAALLCAAARLIAVKTITVRHGYTGWSQSYSSSLPLNSDHFIVWSDFEADRIHRYFPEYRERVHSFGFPGLQAPMETLRLGQPPLDKKIFTYMSGPISFMKDRFGDDLEKTLWDVRNAVEAGGYEFVLRLHWRDRRRKPDGDDAKIVAEFEVSDLPLEDEFKRSTAIGASYVSSALLEAAAYGRLPINITEGGNEIPWADNVRLSELSGLLREKVIETIAPRNAFRSGEFEDFLIHLLRREKSDELTQQAKERRALS